MSFSLLVLCVTALAALATCQRPADRWQCSLASDGITPQCIRVSVNVQFLSSFASERLLQVQIPNLGQQYNSRLQCEDNCQRTFVFVPAPTTTPRPTSPTQPIFYYCNRNTQSCIPCGFITTCFVNVPVGENIFRREQLSLCRRLCNQQNRG